MRTHFYKRGDGQALNKTCARCRNNAVTAVAERRAKAEAEGCVTICATFVADFVSANVGKRWCAAGAHETTIEACTNADGVLLASCQVHLARRRERNAQLREAAAALNAAADDLAEQAVGNDPVPERHDEDGEHSFEDEDEFDRFFGSGEELMEVDLPEDSALDAREAELMRNFERALDNIAFESCDSCMEEGFDLKIIEGKCSSCRNDKSDSPVKKWSIENESQPGICRRDFLPMATPPY
ncbi:hypothetical protein NMY22_g16823 [Coprinellus aureogranulatus]|nr:hypothetical protein NMY22_g16823 [Coprinellus aureogranulatus]